MRFEAYSLRCFNCRLSCVVCQRCVVWPAWRRAVWRLSGRQYLRAVTLESVVLAAAVTVTAETKERAQLESRSHGLRKLQISVPGSCPTRVDHGGHAACHGVLRRRDVAAAVDFLLQLRRHATIGWSAQHTRIPREGCTWRRRGGHQVSVGFC